MMLRHPLRGAALLPRRGLSAAFGLLVSGLAGRFTVEASVNADGSGTIVLPGHVIAANGGAQISSNRVSWRIPIGEYARRPRLALSVRYAIG